MLGFTSVPQGEAWVVERFGKFHRILKPGLRWVPVWDFVRLAPRTGQYTIPVFPTNDVAFDFDDGALVVKGAEAVVQLKDPYMEYEVRDREKGKYAGAYRATYLVVDSEWKRAVQDLVENAVRASFNNIASMKEAEEVALVSHSTSPGHMQKHEPGVADTLEKDLAVIGFKLLRITFGDFQASEEVVAAREAIAKAKANSVAAEFVADQRATETMGTLLRIYAATEGVRLEELMARINGDPEMQKELRQMSSELVTRHMSLEHGALTDIRVEGGGDLGNLLATLTTVLKKT